MKSAVVTGPIGQEVFRQEVFFGPEALWQEPGFLGDKPSLSTVFWKDVFPFFAIPALVVGVMWMSDRQVKRWYHQRRAHEESTYREPRYASRDIFDIF
jgi:hypothetical protein